MKPLTFLLTPGVITYIIMNLVILWPGVSDLFYMAPHAVPLQCALWVTQWWFTLVGLTLIGCALGGWDA